MKEGWRITTIGNVTEIYNGGTPSTSVDSYWDGGVQWVTPKDLGQLVGRYISSGERTISPEGIQHSSAKVLPSQSVILSSRAPIGYVAINTVPMATNQGCKGLIPSAAVYSEFLYYFLLYSNDLLNSLGTGATFKELSGGKLGKIEIALPTISEQKRIVEVLDCEFEKIDALKANAGEALSHAECLFQSALRKELDSKNEWKASKLADVVRIINGRAYSKEELLSEGKYRVLRVGNFFTNDSWYYSDLELDAEKYCENGDLLYAWSASFGPKIWDGEKVVYHYHIWKVQPSELIDKMFLYYWLQSYQLTSQVMSRLHGTTMVHITKGIMESTTISFPPIEKQQIIASKLSDLYTKCESLKNQYVKTIGLCDDLKQSLLRKAFNGEL